VVVVTAPRREMSDWGVRPKRAPPPATIVVGDLVLATVAKHPPWPGVVHTTGTRSKVDFLPDSSQGYGVLNTNTLVPLTSELCAR
jgi:hypothetical protein